MIKQKRLTQPNKKWAFNNLKQELSVTIVAFSTQLHPFQTINFV